MKIPPDEEIHDLAQTRATHYWYLPEASRDAIALAFKVGANWMASRISTYPENALNGKETAKEGPPAVDNSWVNVVSDSIDAEIASAFGIYKGQWNKRITKIIMQFAPKTTSVFADVGHDDLAEFKATIAMLSQQLADKKEIIRRLTT